MSVYLPACVCGPTIAGDAPCHQHNPFATLITPRGDEPQISHLPLLARTRPPHPTAH